MEWIDFEGAPAGLEFRFCPDSFNVTHDGTRYVVSFENSKKRYTLRMDTIQNVADCLLLACHCDEKIQCRLLTPPEDGMNRKSAKELQARKIDFNETSILKVLSLLNHVHVDSYGQSI